MVTIDTRIAAAPKQSSGITVTIPVDTISQVWSAPCCPNADCPCHASQATYAAATGPM